MPPRDKRERLRLRAVQEIARERFPYPNERYPHLKTFVNDPDGTMGVMLDKEVLYPDIVVLEWPEKVTKMVAQVESSATVTEQQALDEWLPDSLAGPLYLFVPVGYAREAKRLCRRFRIQLVGLRTWRYMVGYRDLEITDIETRSRPPRGPSAWLPGSTAGEARPPRLAPLSLVVSLSNREHSLTLRQAQGERGGRPLAASGVELPPIVSLSNHERRRGAARCAPLGEASIAPTDIPVFLMPRGQRRMMSRRWPSEGSAGS